MKSFFGLAVIATLWTSPSYSWGGRGHNNICMAAVHLVQNPALKEFLSFRPHVMGHLCNIPDIYWKSLNGDFRKQADFSHFIDPEVIGIPVGQIPLDFSALEKQFNGQANHYDTDKKIFDLPIEMGTLWWRADQMYRLSVSHGKVAAASAKPKDRGEEQSESLPYNKAIFDMITTMGIMGHYIGDSSQPLHNTANHDGYDTGNGGLHSYYEEQTVVFFPETMIGDIVSSAKKQASSAFLKEKTPLEQIRALSALSAKDIPELLKKDPVIKKSTVLSDKGMKVKTAAERKPASEGYKIYRNLILKNMGWSSLLLAKWWDQIYKEAGEPNLSSYKSYRYPFTPEFIPLDYTTSKPVTK